MPIPRTPDQIKLAKGTYRKCRSGDPAEQVPADGLPDPGDLEGEELAIWNDLVPQLVELGVAKAIDSLELRGMCEHYAEYKMLKKLMKQFPEEARRTEEYRRLSVGAKDAWNGFRLIAKTFAMNPSDRAGVRVPNKSKQSGFEARKRG